MTRRAKTRKPRNRKKKSPQPAMLSEDIDTGRRSFIGKMRKFAIGLAVVGAPGAYLVHLYQSTAREHDLSRVDNGRASVVQIHDPQCQLCLALQRETRQALSNLSANKPDYVIADIRTDKGRQFANRYGVQHVTLLLFDEAGKLRQVINGQTASAELQQAFQRLVAQ